MSNNDTSAAKSYFELRGVDPRFYDEYKMPRYLQKALAGYENKRILDIGCGYGQMLSVLKNKGFEHLKGLDILGEAVDFCQSKNLDVSLISDLEAYCENYTGEKFDLVIMSHVVEHLPKDRITPSLTAIRQHLLKDHRQGSFLVMVPNAQSNTNCYWAYEDFTHTTLFTPGSLLYVLKAAGFQQVDFVDPKGTTGFNPILKLIFHTLQGIYKLQRKFWNTVTLSSYHKPSPQIFTYELKALAQ